MGQGYLAKLSTELRDYGLDRPAIVVDLDALDRNIQAVLLNADSELSWRLVAKSLPSWPLLRYLNNALGTKNLMVFSEPMLKELLTCSKGDLLLGRPVLADAAHRVLSMHPQAVQRVQWLIDCPERLVEYADIAKGMGVKLRVSLELDVGLHRGGFSEQHLSDLSKAFSERPELLLSGFMGYEPHLSKLPRLLQRPAQARFSRACQAFQQWGAQFGDNLCFNTGGSTTFHHYSGKDDVNDISFGSVLVLPSDFEKASSLGFEPAVFIATPILKLLKGNPWPGLEWISWLRRNAVDIVIQGGYFMGDPIYPGGFGYSAIFGRSTNQEIWSAKESSEVSPGDIALLRPAQSEFVMSTYGKILAHRSGKEIQEWSTLSH